jgi:hypothetical protein
MPQTNYKVYTVNSAQVTGSHPDFPGLLPAAADNDLRTIANGGHVYSAAGDDFRTFSSGSLVTSTPLEVANFDASTGAKEIYSKISSLATSATVALAYGDSSLSAGSSTSVWSDNFAAVYHFGSNGSLSLNDSSPNGNNLTGVNTPTSGAGQYGGGIAVASASSQYAYKDGYATTAIAMSITCWAKATNDPGFGNYRGIVSSYDTGSSGAFFILYQAFLATAVYCGVVNSPFFVGKDPAQGFGTGSFVHQGMTYSSTNGIKHYHDGGTVIDSAAGNGNLITASSRLEVGAQSNQPTRYFNGVVDEVRVSMVERSANYISAERNNLFSLGAFWSTGSEQAVPSGYLDRGIPRGVLRGASL